MTLTVNPQAVPFPVPAHRRRWRITLHSRDLTAVQTGSPNPTTIKTWDQTILAELVNARGRRLEQKQNSPAQLSFTLNGRNPDAASVLEMQHEVMAWRWDDYTGQDVCMFRGPITQSEDQLSEQSHVVTFTALDYLALLMRRLYIGGTINFTNSDQDFVAQSLIELGEYQQAPGFTVSALLPLWATPVTPAGVVRAASGVLRTRKYMGGTVLGEALDQLSGVINGFEYDVIPNARTGARPEGNDAVRIFYPRQGVTRSDFMLVYGGNVSTLTRALNSSDFTNYARVIGNNGSSDPNAVPLFAEAFTNADPQVGVWSSGDNSASDIDATATLQQRASGVIARQGTLIPSYTLGLRPDRYRLGSPNMGDTVTLRVQSGRLNVNTPIRVVGIDYDIGDDGEEDIKLTVGQPAVSFLKQFQTIGRDINALARR